EGIRKLLHRLRLSWTRPTYKLVKGDPVLQAAFEKELEFIKKNESRTKSFFFMSMRRMFAHIKRFVRHGQK
ncbi:winged helix-turn-helix domain-containing protein, partial [uncultured Anoxybacillus sp.]|uniref:winged helix-turn-helix domain-containing protein n=1 Tax=uncultured Anoxybacillus sp. TaxID=263860 RepID=UPI002637416A